MSVYDHLEFRHLRYIIAVAETGSFTAAAQSVHVAQSAISRQIGEIEDIKEGPIDTTSRPVIYVPFNQDSSRSFHVVVRTAQKQPDKK